MTTDVTTNTDLARAHGATTRTVDHGDITVVEFYEDELDAYTRAAIEQAAVPADQLKEIVLDIRQHIAQGVASEAVEAKRRPGYGTGIYTYLKHKMDDISAMLAAPPAPTKQQPDHLAGGECGVVPQPLTDDEIIDIWAGVSTGHDDTINIIELARAIEAAHGIGPAPLQGKEAGV